MISINASLVMQLRERTGAGMMDCKKFLIATNGDIELAIIEMRKAGQAKADKKSDRLASDGAIVIARTDDGRAAVMLEINCETDFVARGGLFKSFINQVATIALKSNVGSIELLEQQCVPETNETIEHLRSELIAQIGENIQLRRMIRIESKGSIGTYLHGNKIGVMVALQVANEPLGKDIAMHIAANNPMVIDRDQMPLETIAREREIYISQARDSGKPQEIIDKMIEGRLNKFIDETTLLGQPYVKNPDIKVRQLLSEQNAEVTSFVRFEVGEGIAKKTDNFVDEVMAQIKGN